MLDIHNKTLLDEELKKHVQEICKYIHVEEGNDSGKIDVHINEKFGLGYDREDVVRQSFIFYTLCKVYYYNTTFVTKDILLAVFRYISSKYSSLEKTLDKKSKNFIELYVVRGCLFTDFDSSFFLNQIFKDHSTVFTEPLLTHLLLNTEADAITLNDTHLLPKELVHIAQESIRYLIGSNGKDRYPAFNFVDIFYYSSTLGLSMDTDAVELVTVKVNKEIKSMDKAYTSTLAKLFEGYCNFGDKEMKNIELFWGLVKKRKIRINTYLQQRFLFSDFSIAEVKGTSFVCLDTYAHITLGLITLLKSHNVGHASEVL